jgi:putative addiction module CopG family antidote
MSTELSPDLEEFVQQRLATGSYRSGGEVIREAFRLLETREQLLAHIDTGTAQLRNGECTEYDQDSLRALFDEIQERGRNRYEASQKVQ